MAGQLDDAALTRVFNAWRSRIRQDPLLSRMPMPELMPFATAFNESLTGDDEGDRVASTCDALVRAQLEPGIVVRIATFLAECFFDEIGTSSAVVAKRLLGTFGYICGLMITTMVSDVSEIARRDSLTGLENRRAWDEALDSRLTSGEEVAIAMVDLDGLKAINDSRGHEAGDEHLKQFAAELLAALPDPGRAYRFGGDEYAAMSTALTAQELEQRLELLAAKDGVAAFSFGVAGSEADGRDAKVLTERADARMYDMKKRHREAASPSQVDH